MPKINWKRAVILAQLLFVVTASLLAADKIVWKPIPDGIFQIDARAPKLWNLFQAGKKTDPLLLQLGTRFLVIFVRNKEIYEIKPEQLEHKGEDLLWRESNKPAKPLATSDWSTKDIGSASRILVKLADEGRMIDIQIPRFPISAGNLLINPLTHKPSMSATQNPDQSGIISGALDADTIRSSSLYNEDLAPIPASRRSWTTYNYAALWIAMSVNIPTYMLASGMIAGG